MSMSLNVLSYKDGNWFDKPTEEKSDGSHQHMFPWGEVGGDTIPYHEERTADEGDGEHQHDASDDGFHAPASSFSIFSNNMRAFTR